MKDSFSPEEKLLKLIRGEKKQKAPLEKAEKAEKGGDSVFPPTGKHRKIETLPFPHRIRRFPFASLTALVITVSACFLAAAFVYPMLGISRVKLPEVTEGEEAGMNQGFSPEAKPLESYLEGVGARQIFAAVSVSEIAPVPAAAVTNTLDLFKDMTLVGIVSSDPPQAVIEDKKTQKTYYLSRGQSMGDLKVEDIQEGKVILDYLGTKYELYM
ncbi:MAG: hypothetical protein ABIG31_05700 [Candidatus Omnitrophota bacterium]